MSRQQKVVNVTTAADYQELQKFYKFLPDEIETEKPGTASAAVAAVPPPRTTTWQERMVKQYHSHLYKSHVMADLTRYQVNQIGFRWRTKQEVMVGKGVDTCGNKHCPCYDESHNNIRRPVEEIVQWRHLIKNRSIVNSYALTKSSEEGEELKQLQLIPHGLGLFAYQVHFRYREHGEQKEDLVKVVLCLRCAPMIFWNKGDALAARETRDKGGSKEEDGGGDDDDDGEETRSESALSDKREEARERKRRHKQKNDRCERKRRKGNSATKG